MVVMVMEGNRIPEKCEIPLLLFYSVCEKNRMEKKEKEQFEHKNNKIPGKD